MPQLAPIVANVAINLAVAVGASVLSSLLSPKQSASTTTLQTPKGFSFTLQTGEAVPVSAVLGRGRAQGQLIYHNSYGTDNEYLQIVIKVGHGWHDGMETLLIDEKPVTLVGSNADPKGFSVSEYTVGGEPYMWVKYYTGAPGQTADGELVANANPPDRWTAAHKMTGCAYYILTCRYQADLYGSTVPLSGSVWRGLRLYDWRADGAVWGDQSTYVFSTNPAVIRYNYRRGIFVNGVRMLGQGFSAWSCDLAGYTAAANRCDETFHDPVTDTTFKVFEYGREVTDAEEKLSVLSELDASYCGTSFKRGGADVPLPGQQLVSVLTLTDADRLIGYPVQADRKGSVSAKKTMWSGQYVSSELGYAMGAYAPQISADMETLLGGRRSVAMDQPYELLQPRAQMRAQIALRRQLYPGTRVETFTPKAFVLEPGDPVTRVCEWGTVLMVVRNISRVLIDGRWVGVTVTMDEWDNSIVPASGESFVTPAPPAGVNPSSPSRTIAVSGFGIVPYSREGGGAQHPYGRATWTPITDPNVDQVMIRVWPTDGDPDPDHEDFFADAKLTSVKLVGPLQPLTGYSAKAIPIRNDARACAFTNVATFTTTDESIPAVAADVTFDQLRDDLQEKINWILAAAQDVSAAVGGLSSIVQDQDLANFTDKQTLRRELHASVGDTRADYQERIAVAASALDALSQSLVALTATVGDNTSSIETEQTARANADSALTSAVQVLRAALGGNTAQINVVMEAQAATAGYSARYAIRAAVNDGSLRQGAFYIDVPANPASSVRIGLLADQTVFFDGAGNPFALFAAGQTFIDTARIQNLTSANIQAGSITADRLNVSSLSAISANLGTITAGTMSLGGGRVLIDGPNARILISE
jgi:hypothetical protein